MKQDDIEEDTMILKFTCGPDGDMTVGAGFHFSEDMPEDVQGGYSLLLKGIMAMMEVDPEALLKAALYADFGADLERTEKSTSETSKPNLSVVDFKGRVQ